MEFMDGNNSHRVTPTSIFFSRSNKPRNCFLLIAVLSSLYIYLFSNDVLIYLDKSRQVTSIRRSDARNSIFWNDHNPSSIRELLSIDNPTARNLAVFDAVGRAEVLGTLVHNVKSHFATDDWSCLVFIYVAEDVIPDDNPHLEELRNTYSCMLMRIPGLNWGHWLQILNPLLTVNYDHVAILLDDIFIPNKGSTLVSVPVLMENMNKHNLASISPSIHGNPWHLSTVPKTGPLSKCLAEVEMIEVFFQIFTREAWECFYSQLDHTNGGGYCYDKCYAQHCAHIGTNAVDYRMIGYHLERALHQIPEDAKSENMDYIPKKKPRHEGHSGNMQLCARNQCGDSRFDIWQTRQFPLSCAEENEQDNDINDTNQEDYKMVMHTFSSRGEDNDPMLAIWGSAWREAGFQTRILTPQDAYRYNRYNEIEKLLQNSSANFHSAYIQQFLAMSVRGNPNGGWLSSKYVLPVHRLKGEGLTFSTINMQRLPNDGRFTVHEDQFFGLMSGSVEEWERILRHIVDNYYQYPHAVKHLPLSSSNNALEALVEIHKIYPHAYHTTSTVVGADFDEVLNKDGNLCKKMKNNHAVRVHDGGYLKDLSSKGLISESTTESMAISWMKKYADTCWKIRR